jgi:transposase
MSESASSINNHPDYVSIVNESSLKELKIKELEGNNTKFKEEIKNLKHNLELYKKALYGKRSERLTEEPSAEQIRLFESELETRPVLEEKEEIEVKPNKRKKRKRYTDSEGNLSHFPEHLPRETVELKPEEIGQCDTCGKDKIKLSEKVTEKLCVVPAKYFVKRYTRGVYGCKCKGCQPISAEAPYGALPKTVLDETFLAAMLTQKFAWHLPFYRQSQMLRELGVELNRDILISAANKLGDILTPIVHYMSLEIKKCELVQIDESPITVAKKTAKGKSKFDKNSYFWPILGGKQVVFTYTGDRKHCNVGNILDADFKGVLLSDGYKAYFEYCKSSADATLALCWDHARRRFYEIKDTEPLALEALEQIKVFYRVEKEIKELLADDKLEPDKVPKYRKEHALPALSTFKTWCETVRDSPEVLPKDKLMAACSYPLNHWEGLTTYLEHGFVPISNIAIEQQIRNLKLGAKNWLFAASEAGAHTIAMMNSLVCTCKMNNINILEYFTDILKRLESDSAKKLTPLNWAREKNYIDS